MDKIIDFINTKTNNKYSDLLFFGGKYSKVKSKLYLQFLLKNSELKTKQNIQELTMLSKEYVGNLAKDVEIELKSNKLNMAEFKNTIVDIIREEEQFSNISESNIDFDFDSEKTVLNIKYNLNVSQAQLEQLKTEIEEKIFNTISQEVICNFVNDMDNKTDVLSNRMDRILEDNMIFEEMKNAQIVDVNVVNKIYGEYEFKKAYIAGNFGDEADMSVVGFVKSCSIREINKEGETETKKYMSFELEYENSTVRCVWFLPKSIEEPKELEVGKSIVVYGKINIYHNEKSIRVSSLAEATFNPPKIVYRKCPSNYRFVKPEPYEFTEQIGLFFEEKKTEKSYLLENTFVVYDLETTGINSQTEKIIDIGAFKIVDGRIVEKFCTFINPEKEIPEEATKVNRITNAMVEHSPTIEMALPDFYKFCEGSILVGYNNIGFDDLFIDREAKNQFYKFENKRDDVFNIAKDKIKGLNNYKLSTVCNAMNVPLIDAHRAANDAVATAKLFIKLVEKYY